jgi:hypothetical protein
MGTGKSTFFVIALAYVTKAQVDVVAPNIEGAEGIYLSLVNTIEKIQTTLKDLFPIMASFITKDDIGKKIDKVQIARKITVMTPGYLGSKIKGKWTIID